MKPFNSQVSMVEGHVVLKLFMKYYLLYLLNIIIMYTTQYYRSIYARSLNILCILIFTYQLPYLNQYE